MSREIAIEDDDMGADEAPPYAPLPPPVIVPTNGKKAKPATPPKEKDEPDARERLVGEKFASPELKAMRAREDESIKDILERLATDGAYRIRVKRVDPTEVRDPVTGKMVKTEGHLKTYTTPVDEETLAERHGGGRYELLFTRKAPDGKWLFVTQRTVDVAGDPRVDDVPRTTFNPPTTPLPQQESPTIVGKMFDVLSNQLEAARAEAKETGTDEINPAMMMLLRTLEGQLAGNRDELAALREQATRVATVKPPEDPFKERMLERLMVDDSSRLAAVRMQYESEIRMLKEQHATEIRTMREAHSASEQRTADRADRDMQNIRMSHDRELATVRMSNDATTTAFKSSIETQTKVLESEIRKLERDNTELRVEVKELRAKKEKGIIETMKEVQAVKDAFGDDSEDSGGTVAKLMEALPGAIEVAKNALGKSAPAAPPARQQPQMPPQIVQHKSGQRFLLKSDGTMVGPLKQKKKVIQTVNPDGTPGPELPEIPPAVVGTVVGFLERAFSGNQDPEVVAQTYRSQVPEEVMQVIRDHGVDVFLSKVAKLQSASPLSTQGGKNWIRKVGSALVGE